MIKLFLTSLLIFAFTIQCALANQSVELDKGQLAPFPGTLLDKETANKVKNELIEKDALVKTNESLNRSIKLYKDNQDILGDQKDMLIKQNIELTKTLNDARDTSDWVKVGYFVLGVVVTGAAAYGASRLVK